jgi:hypothetical protein
MLEILEPQTGKIIKPLVRKIGLAPIPTPADCLSALKAKRHYPGSRLFREAEIVTRICQDNHFVEWCVEVLYERQDRQEQATGVTIYQNEIGFSASDAKVLSEMAKAILAGCSLSAEQLAVCRQQTKSGVSRLGRYRKQLLDIINGLPPNSDSSLSLETDGETATDDNALTVDAIGSERIQ